MNLTPAEIRAIQEGHGLYITEKCDGCGKALNQSVRYTITGKPEVYCSAACRDFAFFEDRREAKKRVAPKSCAYCGSALEGKHRQANFCNTACRVGFHRADRPSTMREARETVTEA